jgi:hypothetical protein
VIYVVNAQFRADTSAEFLEKLTDGSIANQRPDGQEIVASMNRARIDGSGVVRWSELCYCSTPLAHERATVYDQHFTNLETKEADTHVEFEGQPFMEYLRHDD